MASHYGIVFPEFWSGETGRAIRTDGGKDGQLIALYLMSAPNATMIGLFSLPVRDIRHDTGIGEKGLARAFRVLGAVGFADYDGRTQHVWVREMAKFRLGLQKRSPLDPDDKRVTGIQRLYDKLAENPFLEPFFDRYAKELRLKGKRRSGRPLEPLQDVALRRGFEGPSKPVNRDQGSEIRDQVQGSGSRDQGTGIREDLPPLTRRPVENLSKTQTHEDDDASRSTQTRGVATALRDSQQPARTGSVDRRRGMESQDPRPVGPIGFRGPGPADAHARDVGSGTSAREATRTAADLDAATDAVATDGRTAEPRGVPAIQGGLGGARADSQAANDGRGEQLAAEPDARASSRLAHRTGAEDAGGKPSGAGVDSDADRVGETPGQAELRRTIERLRRGHAR